MCIEMKKALSELFGFGFYESPTIPPRDRNFDLGVQAAEIQQRRVISIPHEIYAHREETAAALLAELIEEGSFDYARFDAGYQSEIHAPYDEAHDVLKLKEKVRGVFETDTPSRQTPEFVLS